MNKKKDFQENALKTLFHIESYNRWIVSKFEKYLGKNILELGSGLGNITLKVKDQGFNITPSDSDRYFLSHLKKIDKHAMYLDILNITSFKKYKFDTIIAINVIEHVENDYKAFKNVHNLLPNGGCFVILVPAHKFLFGSYDKLANHHCRYSKKDLIEKLERSGFSIKRINYHNKLSAVGWFISARILQKNEFSRFQLSIVNFLVPFLDLIDRLIPFDFGMSIVCIATKFKKRSET